MAPFIENADNQEERACRNAVVDLLQHRAAQPSGIQGENSQRAEAQVADRGICHQLLHIFLHQRNQRSVDDPDDGKGNHPAPHFGVHDDVREEWQRESDEAISSHLQQNTRQNDRAGGWRFHVRIRQPGVERKHRDFDCEGEKECQEQQYGKSRAVCRVVKNVRGGFVQSLNAERVNARLTVVVEIKEQHGQQHGYRAEQCVKEEFDGGIEFPRAAPDADKQVHRHQHRFPENEEQKEIQRHKDAQHAGLEHQKPDVVFLHAVLDRLP